MLKCQKSLEIYWPPSKTQRTLNEQCCQAKQIKQRWSNSSNGGVSSSLWWLQWKIRIILADSSIKACRNEPRLENGGQTSLKFALPTQCEKALAITVFFSMEMRFRQCMEDAQKLRLCIQLEFLNVTTVLLMRNESSKRNKLRAELLSLPKILHGNLLSLVFWQVFVVAVFSFVSAAKVLTCYSTPYSRHCLASYRESGLLESTLQCRKSVCFCFWEPKLWLY